MTGRFFLAVGILILFCTVCDAATYNCSNCSGCNDMIALASAGDTVYPTGKITHDSGDCIIFNGVNGVSFDCQNNYIEGNDTGYGIRLIDSSHNSIVTCKIIEFDGGIKLERSNYNSIIESKAGECDIFLNGSDNNVITSSRVYMDEGTIFFPAIYLENSDNNSINGTEVDEYTFGIVLNYSHNNSITSNIIGTDTPYNGYGIKLYASQNNSIRDNVLSSNKYAVHFEESHGNGLLNNTFRWNGESFFFRGHSIDFVNSHSNRMRSNMILKDDRESGLYVDGDDPSAFVNDIDTSNTIDGRAIHYFDGTYKKCPDDSVLSFDSLDRNVSHLQLVGCSNVTITGLANVTNGIYLAYAKDSRVENNGLKDSRYGIKLYMSEGINLTGNIIDNTGEYGIWIYNSRNCLLSSNKIEKIAFYQEALYVEGDDISYFQNSIDESNTINSLPVQYYDGVYRKCPDDTILQFNSSGTNISHLELVGCRNVTIKSLVNEYDGIYLTYTDDSKIEESVSRKNKYGIKLRRSTGNTLSGNTVNGNIYCHICLEYSNDNVISGNTGEESLDGIRLQQSDGNVISNNYMWYYEYRGIGLYDSKDNILEWNTLCVGEDVAEEDIGAYGDTTNSGKGNRCYYTYNWNDAGSDGCRYSCQNRCVMWGNYKPCDTVTLTEVVDGVNDWSEGDLTLTYIIELINSWTDPENSPPS